MYKYLSFFLSGSISLLALIPAVHAEVIDQVVSSGQYGQASANNTGDIGWAAATVSIEKNGINRTAHLFHVSSSPSTGYNYWTGNIPVDAVIVNGVNSISVNIDTCSVNYIAGCGPVYLTVTTSEPATGWIDNGVRQYDWNGVIYREAGARQVRFSSATGSVHGVPIDTTRAFMGKYNDVSITVSTPE